MSRIQDGVRRHLELDFATGGILSYSDPCMANIYQCTKFDENFFIYDWDMAKTPKFKMVAAAILDFAKARWDIWPQ